jgi:hypothetical protein
LTSFAAATAPKNGEDNREQGEKQRACKRALREAQSFSQQMLAEAIESGQMGPEGLLPTRAPLLDLFARIERLGEQVDEAFGGQAFLPNVGPTSPANRRRFNAYFDCHKKLAGLLFDAIALWAMGSGMKQDDDWVPMMIVYMDRQAAQARGNANRTS